MNRSHALLVTGLLALVTAGALAGAAVTLTGTGTSAATTPSPDTAAVTLVRHFYAAVNATIATGDATQFDGLVAPNLVEHPARIGEAPGRAGLVQALMSRRAAFPSLQVIVDAVAATGSDGVTARVHLTGDGAGEFLGLPLSPDLAAWGPLDLFRIADGRIVERWGAGSDPISLQPWWRTPIAGAETNASRTIEIETLVFDPGARWTFPADGSARFVMAMDGNLVAVVTDGGAPAWSTSRAADAAARPTPIAPGQTTSVSPNDLLVAPPDTGLVVSNDTALPVEVTTVVILAPFPHGLASTPPVAPMLGNPALANPSTGDVPAVHFHGLFLPPVNVPVGAVLGLGRIDLAPGARLDFSATDATTLLISQNGQIELETSRTTGALGAALQRTTVSAGEGAVIPAGMESRWRSGAALTNALVLTIAPAA
jgi:predicted ester cyclase